MRTKWVTQLRDIRNNASAHKSKNSKRLMLIHNKFPIKNLTAIGFEIGKLESHFTKIADLIIEKSAEQVKVIKNDNNV